MLDIENVSVFYGDVQVLRSISLTIKQGEIVSLVGSNAAGKSTTVNTIAGLLRPREGRIRFMGEDITSIPAHKTVERGLVLIPENRRLFPFMSVIANLELGCYAREARRHRQASLDLVFSLFPRLAERRTQMAGSLSGGEQQMVAIGRGLMARPKLMILDEPSIGLAPLMVKKTLDVVREINSSGTTVLLVEQNVQHALAMATRGYVLENGHIVMSGDGPKLLDDPALRKAYLGM